jgi:hypothetical protein
MGRLARSRQKASMRKGRRSTTSPSTTSSSVGAPIIEAGDPPGTLRSVVVRRERRSEALFVVARVDASVRVCGMRPVDVYQHGGCRDWS